ncbi:MAG TPA: Uma2 family endonuclease [Actinomycetota bacterium]|nr:Uma2 family endonuclease [Actinomycetota bacterium]
MASRMLTRADLDALPEDGLRHELIDGALVMTPAPGMAHQDFAFALARALHAAADGTDLKVMMAPYDVVIGPNVVEPDIIVAPRAAFTERDLQSPPLLVVEVRSPSTARLDEGRKRSLYEEAGVAYYWLADPVEQSITVLELAGGRYERTNFARGDEVLLLSRPLAVELIPTRLVKG